MFFSLNLSPSFPLLLPTYLSTLYTSSQWGNQSACYSLLSDMIRLLILAPVSRCRGQSCHTARLPGRASELLSGTTNRCWRGSFTAIVTNRQTVGIRTVTLTDFPPYKKSCQGKSCQPQFDAVFWLHRKSAIWSKLWSTMDENIIWFQYE